MSFMESAGGLALAVMLVAYAFEASSPWLVLLFALAAAVLSVYFLLGSGFIFAALFGAWAFIALRRWQRRRLTGTTLN